MNKLNLEDEIIIGVTPVKNKKGAGKKKLAPVKKKKNNRKIAILIRCTSLIVLIIVLLVFLMVSPMFNITKIYIEGNTILSNEKIISLSGVSLGENIFRISKPSIKSKLTSNAYIENVRINRELPNILKIEITERTIKYMIEYADGYVYINSQGYMIDISKEKKEVPIIIGYSTENTSIEVGNRLSNEDLERLQVANKIIKETDSNEITNLVTKINISNDKNYTLILESQGKTIYLGNCSDITTRIARLKAILEKTEGEEGEIFIDGNLSTDLPRFRKNVF